jgi:hypothetical protein
VPNHVDMDLTVTGDVDSLRSFEDFAQDKNNVLSADKFIPYPDEYKKMDEIAEVARNQTPPNYSIKDGFNSGGYEWCVKNWGTKWGIYSTELLSSKLEGKKGNLKYNCQSAWSPPKPVIVAMSSKFPTLKFSLKYYERGCAYKGTFVVVNGEVQKDETSDYRGNRGG